MIHATPECQHKGCKANAPYGFRLPGIRSDLPANKRGYLHACAEHREGAIERREKATKVKA